MQKLFLLVVLVVCHSFVYWTFRKWLYESLVANAWIFVGIRFSIQQLACYATCCILTYYLKWTCAYDIFENARNKKDDDDYDPAKMLHHFFLKPLKKRRRWQKWCWWKYSVYLRFLVFFFFNNLVIGGSRLNGISTWSCTRTVIWTIKYYFHIMYVCMHEVYVFIVYSQNAKCHCLV